MVNAAPPLPISTQLAALRFRAETNPLGQAIDLVWDATSDAQVSNVAIWILRRERRFPGKSRRGVVPVAANPSDLTDGIQVYDSTTFSADFEETKQDIEGNQLIATVRQYYSSGTPRDRRLVRTIRREFVIGSDTPTRITVRFTDTNSLTPGTIYYYTAFVDTNRYFSRLTQASALATETQASALANGKHTHHLFTSLPQIHQNLDNTPPVAGTTSLADQSKGQLHRFLEVFDRHADMLQGMIESLQDLHHARRVDSRFLPHLAQYLGWELRDYLDEDGQRNEIIFAPQVYQTVGTIPNIRAIINRLTGWDAEIQEFSRNVLLSVDTSRFERMQSGRFYLDGGLRTNANPLAPEVAIFSLSLLIQSGLFRLSLLLLPIPHFFLPRKIPIGTVNTNDRDAMFKLRTKAFDDQTAYTYQVPPVEEQLYRLPDGTIKLPDGTIKLPDDQVRYNQQTIGIYLTRDVDTEFFSPKEESKRIYQIIFEFLPIQVRALLFLRAIDVEKPYDATQEVQEKSSDIGVFVQEETYGDMFDTISDRIPEWRWLITNTLDSRSVDSSVSPVDIHSRTWHTGLDQSI